MTRTITEIKQQITTEFIGRPEIIAIYSLDVNKTFEEQFSKVSLESILFYVVAFAIHTVESLFATHKSEVNQLVDNERWGRFGWYEKMAKKYQHGRTLITDYDCYNNSAFDADQIAEQQVVKFAACNELQDGQLALKLAKGEAGALEPLADAELAGVSAYFNARGGVKPAGVRVNCISLPADFLKVMLSIQYDALILDANGNRLDAPTEPQPVITAIQQYLSSIDFAGEYSNMKLIDAIQDVQGVVIVDLNAAWFKYSDFDYELIQSRYRPAAGFMQLDPLNPQPNYIAYV